jgi:hypothetical protein
MKRTLLFFILFASTLTGAMEYRGPFADFVSRCRNSKLMERMSEYRTMIDDLVKQGKVRFSDYPSVYTLMQEIARQGDFESLEMLEKELPSDLKQAAWNNVAANANKDEAKRLLVKWARENPTVPVLMQYHPNGVNLLIEMAENKKVPVDDRVLCLDLLARMRATKVLDRIKALMSDQSPCCMAGLSNRLEDLPKAFDLGNVAARVVKELEGIKLQEK